MVQLYLYVHRVDSLTPGVYRYWPGHAELETIKEGDQRVAAAALSLGQELAGNACVAVSMIGDFENASRSYGNRGYRYYAFRRGRDWSMNGSLPPGRWGLASNRHGMLFLMSE